MKLAFLCLLVASGLAACAGGRATETQKAAQTLHVTRVRAIEEKSAIALPESISSRFQVQLDQALYEEDNFQRGGELTIKWQLTAVDEGSRALRYLVSFGAGRAKIMVNAKFYDAQGHQVGAVKAQGVTWGGAFGGSYESVLAVCADAVANYAKDHFSPQRKR